MSASSELPSLPELLHGLDYSDPHGCWVPRQRFRDRDGYILLKYAGKTRQLHRVVYELLCGQLPPGGVVRHRCDNRECVNPLHLQPGTQADNMRDRRDAGRDPVGERNGRAIFTADQVREMRATPSVPDQVYADRFGASLPAVRDARSGKNWKSVG